MDSTALRVRPLEAGELDAWLDGERNAFGYHPGVAWRGVLDACQVLVAEAEDQLVGGAAHMRSGLSVPGGRLPVSLFTSAWVAPESRGRGVFSRLVGELLARTAEAGLPVAVLIPAEPNLYRRFGFGVGSLCSRLRIRRDGVVLAKAVDPPGFLRAVDRDEGVGAGTAVYQRLARGTPGLLDRGDCWWEYSYPHDDPDEPSPLFVVHRGQNGPDGYAAYSIDERPPGRTLVVRELVAETQAAYRALWTHVLDRSQCRWIEAENRPVDEPLLDLLSDPGSVERSTVDSLYVRLVDVPAALSARRYSGEDELVLEVRDDVAGWAAGRWLLAVSGDAAECRPSDRGAEIALDVSALGCAYLGATSFEALERAGRVEELAPGAVRRADALFSWSPAPWLPWDY